jgi:stringent starvation protein B
MSEISTKPYLLRAIYEWCTDNGYTPYLAALVDGQTQVPMQFVKNGEIVLNISFNATSGLKMENDFIRFSARFGGVSRDILVPVENVIAIYARENGQGMAFEVPAKFPARDAGDRDASGDPAPAVTVEPPPALASVPAATAPKPNGGKKSRTDDDEPPTPPKKNGKPTLTRIK